MSCSRGNLLSKSAIFKWQGFFEVDEVYIGTNKHAKNKTPHSQGGNNKMATVGMIERSGRLALEYITKVNIKTIKPVLEQYINIEESQLYTDTSPLYKSYKNRRTVRHTIGEYGVGNNYTNTIEGVFS